MNSEFDTQPIPVNELDLARCIVGPDLIVEVDENGDNSRMYRPYADGTARLIGSFDDPARAWAALDELDGHADARPVATKPVATKPVERRFTFRRRPGARTAAGHTAATRASA